MKNLIKTYLKIIAENKIYDTHNFIENKTIDIINEIQQYVTLPEEIIAVMLEAHCVKSIVNKSNIHGLNFINRSKQDLLIMLGNAINEYFNLCFKNNEMSNPLYLNTNTAIYCQDKYTNIIYRLIIKSTCISILETIIYLKTFFPDKLLELHSGKQLKQTDNEDYFIQYSIPIEQKKIIFENKNIILFKF